MYISKKMEIYMAKEVFGQKIKSAEGKIKYNCNIRYKRAFKTIRFRTPHFRLTGYHRLDMGSEDKK